MNMPQYHFYFSCFVFNHTASHRFVTDSCEHALVSFFILAVLCVTTRLLGFFVICI